MCQAHNLVDHHRRAIDPTTSLPWIPPRKPAPGSSHIFGLFHEASDNDWEQAEAFCRAHRPSPPKILASNVIDLIRLRGMGPRARGVYCEVPVNMIERVIAMGTACRPYPSWRMPRWNRLGVGLHLDDLRKIFEGPDGGRDYTPGLSRIYLGDVVGCGYEFGTGALFFTHNGLRLPDAFVEMSFGASNFQWKEGNDVAWRVDGHVGYMVGSGPGQDERLPSYSEATTLR
ncbi:hypothetical protein BC827DRAFT_1257607 [Russula dissimulans]|nr:hypothetical protein BC827DRAFT_1257607 [Russula dissimulans]